MSESVTFPPAMERFASIDEFFEADERRRDGVRDYGAFWWDGEQGYSDTWRVSASAATGEIYATRVEALRRRGPVELSQVVLLCKIDSGNPGYVRSDLVLEGWNLKCGESFSLQWVLDQVDLVPLSILCRYQHLGAHVHAEVFVGRQAGSRGRAGELILRDDEWEVFRAGLEAGFGDRLELADRSPTAAGEPL